VTDWIRDAAEKIVVTLIAKDAKHPIWANFTDRIAAIIRRSFEAYRDTVFFTEARRKPEQKPAPDWVRDDVVKVDEPGDWEGHNR